MDLVSAESEHLQQQILPGHPVQPAIDSERQYLVVKSFLLILVDGPALVLIQTPQGMWPGTTVADYQGQLLI